MTRLLIDLAMGLLGYRVGGPARVSVFSSALMGTIAGSDVADTVITGQLTISLMEHSDYKLVFTGGVEMTASTGSQLMLPVVGAVAFTTAKTTNVPHVEIARAALIPALLYSGSVYRMVCLRARRADPKGLPREQCSGVWGTIHEHWSLLIPLLVLTALLSSGRTPLFSETIGLALTAIVILSLIIILWTFSLDLCIAFQVALGPLCAGSLRFSIEMIFVVIVALAPAC